MKYNSLFVVIFLLFSESGFAQVRNLGNRVNSLYEEVNPVYSISSNTLYFSRVNHPDNLFGRNYSEDIWYSERAQDGSWSIAKRHETLNIGRYNAVLSVGNDGNTLLLNGVFDDQGKEWIKKGVSLSHWDGEQWGIPEEVLIPDFSWKSDKISAFLTNSADVILIATGVSTNDHRGDIMVMHKLPNGTWSAPESLVGVNSEFNEMSPFVSADGSTLYFSSNRGKLGRTNVYHATRLDEGWVNWSEPVSLKTDIGDWGWQAYFAIMADAKTALFCSTHRSLGHSDIYSVSLKPMEYVQKTGKAVDPNGNPLPAESFIVLANGKKVDSLVVHDDGTYVATLPVGRQYDITLQYINRTWGGATKNKLNSSLHYIKVKGSMLDKLGRPYPRESYTILANNVPIKDITITPDGKYDAFLPLPIPGGEYQISAEFSDGIVPLQTIQENKKLIDQLDLIKGVPSSRVPIKGKIQFVNGDAIDEIEVVLSRESSITTEVIQNENIEFDLPGGKLFDVRFNAAGFLPVFHQIDTRYVPQDGSGIVVESLVFKPLEVGQVLELDRVFFLFGKATLLSESYIQLEELADYFVGSPNVTAEITCHSDVVNNSDFQKELSLKRAQSIVNYLKARGVRADQLKAVGYEQKNSDVNLDGSKSDSRVEIKVMSN